MSLQTFKTTDVLRLEVERDPLPGEYPNRVENGTGLEGGYAWVTPVANSVLLGSDYLGQQALVYVTGTTTSPASNYFYSEPFPVTAGHYARASFRPYRAPYPGWGRVSFYYYNAARTFLSSVVVANNTGYGENTGTSTANHLIPANTAYMAIVFEVAGPTVGGVPTYPYTSGGGIFAVRDVRVVTAPTTTELAGVDLTQAGAKYVNVLGSTHEIRLVREPLQLGTLTATIVDSALDPATASTLRKGRRCRLMALNGTTGVFEPIAAGLRIHEATVTYDVKRKRATDPKHARIELTAVDRTSTLAQHSRPEGVGRVRDLPYVLEGAGVPWNVDGSAQQVATANTASLNDNATAVDQVALTRDTAQGYAWVDRKGVLNVYSQLPDPEVELAPGGGTFDVNLTGYYGAGVGGTVTLARDTAVKRSGAASARLTAGTNVTSMWVGTVNNSTSVRGAVVVTPGTTYTIEAWTRSAATARTLTLYVDWWTFSGDTPTYISTSGDDYNVGTTISTVGAWTKVTKTVVAPSGAYAADLFAGVTRSDGGVLATGEVHHVDDLTLRAAAPIRTLSEADYADLALSYDEGRIVNSLDFKWLLFNTYTGATDEYHLTGYEDAASVAAYGRMHKTLTIHGPAADAQAIANNIFARSATPAIVPTGVQVVALKSAADVTAKAFTDLYALTRVVNTGKGISAKVRVTSLAHTITTDKWVIEEGYSTPTAIAAPQVQPPVQVADQTGDPFLMAVYTPPTGGVAASWVDVNSWTVVESSGITVSGAVFTFARPGRYRLSATLVYDASGSAGAFRAGKFVVDGLDTPYHSTVGLGTAAYATVEMDRLMRLNAGSTVKISTIAAALVNLLGGLSGHGNTRFEAQYLGE